MGPKQAHTFLCLVAYCGAIFVFSTKNLSFCNLLFQLIFLTFRLAQIHQRIIQPLLFSLQLKLKVKISRFLNWDQLSKYPQGHNKTNYFDLKSKNNIKSKTCYFYAKSSCILYVDHNPLQPYAGFRIREFLFTDPDPTLGNSQIRSWYSSFAKIKVSTFL